MKTRTLLSTAVLVAVGTLAGCGGSGGGSTRIGGSQVTGVISAINTPAPAGVVAGVTNDGKTQIVVNDVPYTLDENVNIQVENAPGDPSALAEGQVVTIETATDGNGENLATAVYLADEVEGVVFSVDQAGSTMNVMGLDVRYTADTRFEWDDDIGNPETLGDPQNIAMGWVVEVHGFPDDTGIVATRIEVKSQNWTAYDDDLEVKGILTGANPAAIAMGAQSFALEPGTDTSDMPGDQAQWVGMYVEVKTVPAKVDPTAGTVTATEVEPEERESDRDHDDYDEAEIHGIFSYSDGVARVNGEIVHVSDRISVQTLQAFDGEFVEVEGRYENGVLVVYEIEHDDD